MASKLSGTIDAGFNITTYDWTIENLQRRANVTLYSDPFETGDNVSWQAVLKFVDGITHYGLKFLGCSVLGPCFTMPVLLEVYTKNSRFRPVRKVFSSTLDELCEFEAKLLISSSICSTLFMGFCITTRKLGEFVITPGTFLQDLDPNVKNRSFTNVAFKVGNPPVTLRAHKEILAARSSVFAAMFSANMIENEQNLVTISDIDAEVFQQLLKYIYTGKTEANETTVASLLVAADKYDLGRLKTACERAIFANISISTAIDRLLGAEKHNAQQLKSHILQFIVNNADSVMRGNGWKTLAENPPLLIEVHQAIAKK